MDCYRWQQDLPSHWRKQVVPICGTPDDPCMLDWAGMMVTQPSVVEADGLVIRPVDLLQPARLGTHHDHRLAMAFGLLGLVVDGIEIEEPDVVSKSWPGYWSELDRLPARLA